MSLKTVPSTWIQEDPRGYAIKEILVACEDTGDLYEGVVRGPLRNRTVCLTSLDDDSDVMFRHDDLWPENYRWVPC